ncbi:MAG: hypothetical protein ACYCOO_02530 [Chitinophagaceae bacterium]
MPSTSFDPRVKRLNLSQPALPVFLGEGEQWQAFEVFHQQSRGAHHEHVGSVHAPNSQLALVFAKEQFGRRKKCVNIWVVASADIFFFPEADEDMFAGNLDKIYRDASGFKVMEKINQFKKSHPTGPAGG